MTQEIINLDKVEKGCELRETHFVFIEPCPFELDKVKNAITGLGMFGACVDPVSFGYAYAHNVLLMRGELQRTDYFYDWMVAYFSYARKTIESLLACRCAEFNEKHSNDMNDLFASFFTVDTIYKVESCVKIIGFVKQE